MKNRINAYFAALIITIAGVGATSLIVHIANSTTAASTIVGSKGDYSVLRQTLLK